MLRGWGGGIMIQFCPSNFPTDTHTSQYKHKHFMSTAEFAVVLYLKLKGYVMVQLNLFFSWFTWAVCKLTLHFLICSQSVSR